jgi:hypothetical protein
MSQEKTLLEWVSIEAKRYSNLHEFQPNLY